MESLVIKKIKNLAREKGISQLVAESKEQGFRFLQRLVDDYNSGANMFNKTGEAIYGVYNGAELLAVGGINQDPFSPEKRIGRLRRFYVQNESRRHGVGRTLVTQIIVEASNDFDIVVLKTDTEQADKFYQSLGFIKSDQYPNSTHYYIINDK